MVISAPIYALKRKAKLLSRKPGVPLHEALDIVAKEQGYKSWGLLIRDHDAQKPKPDARLETAGSFQITTLPLDPAYRAQAIELADATFSRVMRRIEPDNPELTQHLWNAADYVDNHHLTPDMLPISSDYALSLIEAFMVHHVIGLAVEADEMAAAE